MEQDKILQNSMEKDDTAIDCTFISVWDDFGEITSEAKFDPITRTVFDVQIANLSDDFVEALESCSAEYVEINGKRFLLGEMQDDGTYTFADVQVHDRRETRPLDKLIFDVSNKKTQEEMREAKPVYHERF